MSDTPNVANPPTVEWVLGDHSAPLTQLTAVHFGRLWAAPANGPLLGDNGLPAPDVGAQMVRPWAELIDELRALRHLEDDWDGQGAKAPPPDLVDGAIALALHFQANAMRAADYAVAGVNGTVIFEWHDATHYLEIEVTAPDRAEGRAVRKGSDVTEVFSLSRRS
jgi:hypothetical protein